jgi:hypothetical protein
MLKVFICMHLILGWTAQLLVSQVPRLQKFSILAPSSVQLGPMNQAAAF